MQITKLKISFLIFFYTNETSFSLLTFTTNISVISLNLLNQFEAHKLTDGTDGTCSHWLQSVQGKRTRHSQQLRGLR